MKLDIGRALDDAWNTGRRDIGLLHRIAGPLCFLPLFATLLLVPNLPAMPAADADQVAMLKWANVAADWIFGYGGWVLAAEIVSLFCALVMMVLYLSGGRPTVGDAMVGALRLMPRYLLAAVLVSVPAGFIALPVVGVLLLLPVIYAFGRLMMTGPILVAERPIGVLPAIGKSVRMSRGNGLVLTGVAGLMLFGGQLAAMPFQLIGEVADGAPMLNPVVAAMLDGAAALMLAAALVASSLVRIAIYRRLSAAKQGI